jgi:hypothetical protein
MAKKDKKAKKKESNKRAAERVAAIEVEECGVFPADC